MQVFKHSVENLPYTEMAKSNYFNFTGIEFPKKIELTLNVHELKMGVEDGSALGVMFERTIEGVVIGDIAFQTVSLNFNEEVTPWLQVLTLEEGEIMYMDDPANPGKRIPLLDENGNPKKVLLGNSGRFRYFLSQASIGSPKPIPSFATFDVAVLVK